MVLCRSKIRRRNQIFTESGLISFVGLASWVVALFETNSPASHPSSPPSIPAATSPNSSSHAQPVEISLSVPLSSLSAYSFTMTVRNSHLICRNRVPFPFFFPLYLLEVLAFKKDEARRSQLQGGLMWLPGCVGRVFIPKIANFTLQVSFTTNSATNSNPTIDKSFIRRRLAWITTAIPEANPSRSTLQAVNSFLIGRAV